jgi:hypothetical protein
VKQNGILMEGEESARQLFPIPKMPPQGDRNQNRNDKLCDQTVTTAQGLISSGNAPRTGTAHALPPSLYLANCRHRGAVACVHNSMTFVRMYEYVHQGQWKLLFTRNYIVSFTFKVSHVISTTLAIYALEREFRQRPARRPTISSSRRRSRSEG